MSTNPQSPSPGSRSGAAAEGQSGPAYDPKAPPTPAGAEGRQSPGLLEGVNLDISRLFEEALAMVRYEVEMCPIPPNQTGVARQMKLKALDTTITGFRHRLRDLLSLLKPPAPVPAGLEADVKASLDVLAHEVAEIEDKEDYAKACKAMGTIRRALAALGAAQTMEHSEDPLGMAKSLHDAGVMERKPAEPLHEEGTAGVDLADLLDEAARNLSKDIPCNPDGSCIRCRTFRAAARLRAQAPASILDPKSPGIPASTADTVLHFGAPASSPRDLEAEVYTESSPEGSAVGLRLGKMEVRLSFGAPLLMARNLEEAVAEQVSDENFLRLQQAAEREPHGPFRVRSLAAHPPEDTPIEKAAREGLHQIMRDAATITQRLTGDVIVLADRIHDIARASLSSLPQEGAAGEGEPLPSVGEPKTALNAPTWAPKRIYLQPADEDMEEEVQRPTNQFDMDGASWCEDRVNDFDVEYVRADLVPKAAKPPLSPKGEGSNTSNTNVTQEGTQEPKEGDRK